MPESSKRSIGPPAGQSAPAPPAAADQPPAPPATSGERGGETTEESSDDEARSAAAAASAASARAGTLPGQALGQPPARSRGRTRPPTADVARGVRTGADHVIVREIDRLGWRWNWLQTKLDELRMQYDVYTKVLDGPRLAKDEPAADGAVADEDDADDEAAASAQAARRDWLRLEEHESVMFPSGRVPKRQRVRELANMPHPLFNMDKGERPRFKDTVAMVYKDAARPVKIAPPAAISRAMLRMAETGQHRLLSPRSGARGRAQHMRVDVGGNGTFGYQTPPPRRGRQAGGNRRNGVASPLASPRGGNGGLTSPRSGKRTNQRAHFELDDVVSPSLSARPVSAPVVEVKDIFIPPVRIVDSGAALPDEGESSEETTDEAYIARHMPLEASERVRYAGMEALKKEDGSVDASISHLTAEVLTMGPADIITSPRINSLRSPLVGKKTRPPPESLKHSPALTTPPRDKSAAAGDQEALGRGRRAGKRRADADADMAAEAQPVAKVPRVAESASAPAADDAAGGDASGEKKKGEPVRPTREFMMRYARFHTPLTPASYAHKYWPVVGHKDFNPRSAVVYRPRKFTDELDQIDLAKRNAFSGPATALSDGQYEVIVVREEEPSHMHDAMDIDGPDPFALPPAAAGPPGSALFPTNRRGSTASRGSVDSDTANVKYELVRKGSEKKNVIYIRGLVGSSYM